MSTTWSSTGSRSVKAVCSTGSESAPTTPSKATNTVAFSSAVAGNTVTIRGLTFTAIANGGTPANTTEFAVGAGGSANTDTGTAFAAAVNANRGRLGMSAVNATGTVTLTADDYGAYANVWTVTKVGTPITLGGATFASGVDIQGVNLNGVKAVRVFAEAATAGQTLLNGNIIAYAFNSKSGRYVRWAAADLAVGASTIAGVSSQVEILATCDYALWIPSGVTISSGSCNVWMNACDGAGNAL